MTLANNRFVPIYFDLGAMGPAYDSEARGFAIKLDPRLEGISVSPPDVYAVTAAGEKLGSVSNFATENEVLAMMRKVIADTGNLAAETEEEDTWDVPRRAWLRYCIGDSGAARLLLDEPKTAEEGLMLAHIERCEGNLKAARAALDETHNVSDGDRAAELGRIELLAGNLEESLAAFEAVPQGHPARSEVDYHRGVLLFHLGHVAAAKAVWRTLVRRFREDRWSYRADWALEGANEETASRTTFVMGAYKTALGRHGYMGRRNPDLTQRESR